MTEKTDDLIAEARILIADCRSYNFGLRNADRLAHEIAPRLADALETVRENYREALISRAIDATVAEDERDAALAAIERVRAVHRKFTYYELEDSCPDTSEDHREERHHESDEIGEFYCEDMPTGDVVCDLCRDADGERMDWPCPTIQALDVAPEPEEKS